MTGAAQLKCIYDLVIHMSVWKVYVRILNLRVLIAFKGS